MNKKTIRVLVIFVVMVIIIASMIVFTKRSKQNTVAPNINYSGGSGDCGCGGSGDCGCSDSTKSNYGGCSGCGK